MFKRFYAEGTEAGLDLDIEVEPDKRVYCFFGRNGAGKTILLENLGKTLLLAHTIWNPPPESRAPSVEAVEPGRVVPRDRYAGTLYEDAVFPALKGLTFRFPSALYLDEFRIKAAARAFTIMDIDTWRNFRVADWLGRPYSLTDRPVVAISARGRGFTQNLTSDRIRLLGSHADRFVRSFLRTYQTVTRQKVETESLAEWLVARVIVNPAFAGSDDRSFEAEVVLRLMEELDPGEFGGITAKPQNGVPSALRYAEGMLWLGATPIDKLPSGFVSIIRVFQEILGGYAGWTAFQDQKDLANVEGIVLIDEIEAHLHPMWQAKILPLLKRFFPHTTFYVCTHSPLVVATTDEGEAYELVKNGRRITANKLGNPRAWYLADVYEQAFHVDLPMTDDAVSVPDLLLEFSIKVKEHLRTKEPALKAEAEALYQRIIPSVPESDPRRASLDALRGMLQ